MDSSGRRMPRVSLDDVYLTPVHLNVGGTTYTTTLDTLTRYPDSKIAKLFNGTLSIPVDSINNHYFLDVNGSVFAHILDFLRYKELILPEGFSQLQLLKKQAEYFEIEEMVEQLKRLRENDLESVEVSESEEKLDTYAQGKAKKRRRRKISNPVEHVSNEKKVVDLNPEEEEENSSCDVVGELSGDGVDLVHMMDPIPQRGNNDFVFMICDGYSISASINIYSLGNLSLEDPLSTESIYRSEKNGFCKHLVYNCGYALIPCMLHFIHQFLSKGYCLSSFTHTSYVHLNLVKRELIFIRGDVRR